MMVSLLWLTSLACHNVPYTTITRQRTVHFGNIRRFSVHSPLTKDTGETLGYRLHFSQLSYAKEKFSTISTVNNNSRLSLTLSSTIVYISHILYAVLDYCPHFSIYFCPVWLAIYILVFSLVWSRAYVEFSVFLSWREHMTNKSRICHVLTPWSYKVF